MLASRTIISTSRLRLAAKLLELSYQFFFVYIRQCFGKPICGGLKVPKICRLDSSSRRRDVNAESLATARDRHWSIRLEKTGKLFAELTHSNFNRRHGTPPCVHISVHNRKTECKLGLFVWKRRMRLCHPDEAMENDQSSSPRTALPSTAMEDSRTVFGRLLLAIDTCGPVGSVALGRLAGKDLEILAQIELEGRSYSSTLVAAVAELLASAGVGLNDLGGIVAVNGPGSFTGVRVGLSAVKGLADPGQIPVVALSRLAVLSRKAGVPSAAFDAHRGEVFLRLERAGQEPTELLAGASELAAIQPAPLRVAVCDEAAAALLGAAWPGVQLVKSAAPMAADALRMGEARLVAGAFVDLALLDGHYLRRSDAEIFGEVAAGRVAGTQRP
jgi:tRNA threonylcarbamoyladenosine biosynthesis protein TsaB